MTSLVRNYGWAPEQMRRYNAMKEQYGQCAHISSAQNYAGLKFAPKVDSYVPAKQHEKSSTAKKVLIGVVTTALALFALKKGTPKIKSLLSAGKKASTHAPQKVSEADRKMAQECLDKLKNLKNKSPKTSEPMPMEVVTGTKFKKMYGYRVKQDVIKNNLTGKSKTKTEFYGEALDTKPLKIHKIVDGKKVTEIKGRNGVIDSFSTSFNKETGIITKKHQDGRIIQFNKKGDRIQYKLDANGQVDGPVWVQHKNGSKDLYKIGTNREYQPTFWRAENGIDSYLMAPENFQKAIKDFNLPFQI